MIQDYEALVERDFRRNVAVFAAFDALWGLGLPFALFVVLVPAYLNLLTAPKFVIGVGSALGALVMPLQLFADRLIGGVHRKRNVWLIYSCSGLAYLTYGLLGFILPAEPNTWRIIFFLLTMVVFVGTINLGQPIYWSILTDNCPIHRRGRLMAMRTAGLGLAGVANFLPARWVYRHWPAPDCFHLALIIAGSIFVLACLSVLLIRDHIDPIRLDDSRKARATPILRETFGILKRLWGTANYRVFMFFMIVLSASYSLAPFLVTYANDCLALPANRNQLFNLIYLIASPLAGLTLGILADRRGYRSSAIVLSVLSAGAFLLALFAHTVPAILAAYALYCCVVITIPSILCNMSVELLPRENPSHLIAAGNLFCLTAAVGAPAVCGRIIDMYRSAGQLNNGYLTVFIVAITLALVGGLGMLLLVQEPRSGRVYVIKDLNRP